MKIFLQFIITVLTAFIIFKFWPSKSVAPLPAPVPTPVIQIPTAPTPVPTRVPVPNKNRYVRNLEDIFEVLTSDIVEDDPSNQVIKRLYKKGELKQAWKDGQEMHKQDILTTEDAQHVVSFIEAMIQIEDIRHVYYDRYEALYNKPKRRLGAQMERNYLELNLEWKNKTRVLAQQALSDLSWLGSDLYDPHN